MAARTATTGDMSADESVTSNGAGQMHSNGGVLSNTTSESGFDGHVDDAGVMAPPAAPSQAARPTSTFGRGMTQASLGADTEGLILYDLTDKRGSTKAFSPHSIKTVLDLKLLGIGAERQRLTFVEIRTHLAAKLGDDSATVPTLELADGNALSDSWSIAQYLADRHPRGSMLFPTASSRPFASLLNSFGKVSLAPHLGPLVRPAVCSKLDDESAAYFEQVKVGKQKMDQFRALDDDERQRKVQGCIDAIELIQQALAGAQEQRAPPQPAHVVPAALAAQSLSSSPLWIEGGAHPTHADFVVYGWVVHTRAAGRTLVREVWHAHPLVSRWIQDMDAWAGPEITADFY